MSMNGSNMRQYKSKSRIFKTNSEKKTQKLFSDC